VAARGAHAAASSASDSPGLVQNNSGLPPGLGGIQCGKVQLQGLSEQGMTTRRQILLGGSAAAAVVALAGLLRSVTARAASSDKFEIVKSDEEWRRELTSEQYDVLRRHKTERAWSSSLNNEHRSGTYLCVGCDLPLFSSTTKFESETGWPSFWAPIERAIGTSEDRSFFFLARTEVHCRRCGGHLGHVFDDGPQPTGLRYCMNGVVLKFVPD
jgi:peptide-methionine (R)-S-oxide reductase